MDLGKLPTTEDHMRRIGEGYMKHLDEWLAKLPVGWCLAVRGPTQMEPPDYGMAWDFFPHPQGAPLPAPRTDAPWTIYGPMTEDIKAKAAELRLPIG